jgi:hypothetical protein
MPVRIIVALTILLSTTPLAAREVAAVNLPDTLTLAPPQPPLVLNGAGVRSKFFVKVYVGALYLPARTTSAETILRHTGPVAMHLHFLHSEVTKEKLVDAWNDGFNANLSEAERAGLKDRIARFNALFATVHKGDVIRLDYTPAAAATPLAPTARAHGLQGAATTVTINKEVRGTIEGEDFMQAWLRIWLGATPADADLRRALLGAK